MTPAILAAAIVLAVCPAPIDTTRPPAPQAPGTTIVEAPVTRPPAPQAPCQT